MFNNRSLRSQQPGGEGGGGGGDIVLVEGAEEICSTLCQQYQLNEKQEEAALALLNSLKHGI